MNQNGIQIPIFTSATQQVNQSDTDFIDFSDLLYDLTKDSTSSIPSVSGYNNNNNNNGVTAISANNNDYNNQLSSSTQSISAPAHINSNNNTTNPMIALYRNEAIAAASLAKQYASAAASLAQQQHQQQQPSSSSQAGGFNVNNNNNAMMKQNNNELTQNNINYSNNNINVNNASSRSISSTQHEQYPYQNNNNNNYDNSISSSNQNSLSNNNTQLNATHYGGQHPQQQQQQSNNNNIPRFLTAPGTLHSMFPDAIQQQQAQFQGQQIQQQPPSMQQMRHHAAAISQETDEHNNQNKRHKGMSGMQAPPAILINQHIQQQNTNTQPIDQHQHQQISQQQQQLLQQKLQQHHNQQQQLSQPYVAGSDHKSTSSSIAGRLGFSVPNNHASTPQQQSSSILTVPSITSLYDNNHQQQQQQHANNVISSPNIDMLLQNSAKNNNNNNPNYNSIVSIIDMDMNNADSEHNDITKRRERNRVHAKQSRVRKKFFLESLQQQVSKLQNENFKLRTLVQEKIPDHAENILKTCFNPSEVFSHAFTCTESSLLKEGINTSNTIGALYDCKNNSLSLEQQGDKSDTEKKLHPFDQKLISSLKIGQRSLVVTNPNQPDNPICFASQGFYDLTGFTKDEVIGKNCRFLQGKGTSKQSTNIIKVALDSGNDVNVCILNYKKDGTPFWNQLFIGVLRDWNNHIVNCIGVLCEVKPDDGNSIIEDMVNFVMPLPENQTEKDSKDVVKKKDEK